MKTRPLLSEYSRLLKLELRQLSDIFLVIDALDECPEIDDFGESRRDNLLAQITNLLESLHLLITARPHIQSVTDILRDAIEMEICARKDDIKIYLEC